MVVIVTILCVILSLLSINAASDLQIHQLQASQELAHSQLNHPSLPRKLMFNIKIAGYEAKDLVSSSGQNKASTDCAHTRESRKEKEVKVMMHAAKGTRQEWMEGSDPTHEFFTMDYSHVRRRRPIHNKSLRKTVINSP